VTASFMLKTVVYLQVEISMHMSAGIMIYLKCHASLYIYK